MNGRGSKSNLHTKYIYLLKINWKQNIFISIRRILNRKTTKRAHQTKNEYQRVSVKCLAVFCEGVRCFAIKIEYYKTFSIRDLAFGKIFVRLL